MSMSDPSHDLFCVLNHGKLLFVAEELPFKHMPVVALT